MSGCARLIVTIRYIIGLIALQCYYNLIICHIFDSRIIKRGLSNCFGAPSSLTCLAALAVNLTINNLDVDQYKICFTKLAFDV